MLSSHSPESPPVHMAPAPGAGRVLELFSEDPLQHVHIEGEISRQRLEFPILLFQLAQPPSLGHPRAGALAFPPVEGLLADPSLRQTSATGVPASTWRTA